MSNFIDEAERHAELYRKYSMRQQQVLKLINVLTSEIKKDNRLQISLMEKGVTDTEIQWLKRNGHFLPVYK